MGQRDAPAWWWIWQLVSGVVTEEEILQVIRSAMAPHERAALWSEVAAGDAYDLFHPHHTLNRDLLLDRLDRFLLALSRLAGACGADAARKLATRLCAETVPWPCSCAATAQALVAHGQIDAVELPALISKVHHASFAQKVAAVLERVQSLK
jgi:hypothetical protein